MYAAFAMASAVIMARESENLCHLEPSSSRFEGNSFFSLGALTLLILGDTSFAPYNIVHTVYCNSMVYSIDSILKQVW